MKLKITETVLRDGHQSLIATRMTTDEILPILEKMDNVGYNALEVWGGATFDACIRFLNEDPWERLRKIRKGVKKTKLQMLLRGQNLLGYRHYADDIVDEFIKKSIENGIDIIRVFDALNDFRNIEKSIEAILKYNGHAQGCIAYATSDVHTIEYYLEKVKELEKLKVHSICIKDMAGILLPDVAFTLITEIKKITNLEIELHAHATSGIAEMLYQKACEAGVDILDTAISPFAGGTSQPATEPLVHSLIGTMRDTELDINLLSEIADYFKPIKEKYRNSGILNSKIYDIEPKTLVYQVPGGMLSNLLSQLTSQGNEDKYDEVLKEIPTVRKDLGYPPLVTPLSQMVGTQAVFNVLTKERYKVIPKEIKDYFKGLYGKPPSKVNEDICKLAIGDSEIITCRPADLLEDEFENLEKELGELGKSREDVLMYALFPDNAKKFLEDRENAKKTKVINIEII
ncbi:MAG: oxaloacetate decarboxylase subunit alpha [Lachnospirales bacterium]